MATTTPFDAALAALLHAWQVREQLADGGDADLRDTTAAWLALDRARTWVGSFEGAGRQPGWPGISGSALEQPRGGVARHGPVLDGCGAEDDLAGGQRHRHPPEVGDADQP